MISAQHDLQNLDAAFSREIEIILTLFEIEKLEPFVKIKDFQAISKLSADQGK